MVSRRAPIPSEDRWQRRDGKGLLSENQQHRYMRKGLTEARYQDRTVSLADARGQGSAAKERTHAEQVRLLSRYGPRNNDGTPLITPRQLQEMRHEKGDQWVTTRLRGMVRDNTRWMSGKTPHANDPKYPGKTLSKSDPRAAWFYYHGNLGA